MLMCETHNYANGVRLNYTNGVRLNHANGVRLTIMLMV